MTIFVENWPDGSNRAALAPSFADYVENVVLAADTIVRVAIPTGKRYVVFSFDGDFRAAPGINTTNLILPNGTSNNGLGSVLNPQARRLPQFLPDGVTVVTHLILRAPTACKGSIEFYE